MTQPAKPPTTATQYLRGVMIALALLLPAVSLGVLGTVWLWQNDVLLIWGGIASGVALIVYGAELWLVRRRESSLESATQSGPSGAQTSNAADAGSPREQAAWDAVEQLAQDVKPDALDNRDAVLALGARTIETVARRMHPDEKDPLWKFTVPEALALVERVSAQLNQFVVTSVPLGDRLTVGQVLAIYRWRSLATVAEKAYDLWRILRFVNPATAVAGELREKVSRHLLDGMRTEFTRRLARAYVREVGEAAIDLYGGRLRPDLTSMLAADAAPELEATAPLEILIIGQAGSGKSSLINALGEEIQAAVDVVPAGDAFTCHTLSREDVPLTYLTESPSLAADDKRTSQIIEKAVEADAIIWVVSALRPDRATDVEALNQFRHELRQRHDRRPPPIVFLLTNIDRVRPFNDWSPPYDLTDATLPKSRAIGEALSAAADDLGVGVDDIIPVAIGHNRADYNLDLVWARLLEVFDDARNVQLLRRLSEGARTPITRSLWRQAVGAGRVIRKTVFD